MPKFFVLSGRNVGRSFSVKDGTVLGRAPDCDVRLNDRSISRKHARVEREGELWALVDLGSRNGLRQAGERIERIELGDHDEILLGEIPLRFRLDEGAERPLPAPAREAEPELELDVEPESAPAPAPRRPGRPPVPAVELEDEIELEEDIDLGATLVAPSGAIAGARPEAPRPAIPDLSPAELERARILRQNRSGSLLTGDLDQRPLWVRTLVYLVLLAAFAALAYAIYLGVAHVRSL